MLRKLLFGKRFFHLQTFGAVISLNPISQLLVKKLVFQVLGRSISLDQQEVVSGETKLNLQSGMAVSANIKLRSRPVISIVTDMFTKQLEGVKQFR